MINTPWSIYLHKNPFERVFNKTADGSYLINMGKSIKSRSVTITALCTVSGVTQCAYVTQRGVAVCKISMTTKFGSKLRMPSGMLPLTIKHRHEFLCEE